MSDTTELTELLDAVTKAAVAARDRLQAEFSLAPTPLPPGEWWVVDAVEGGVNYVHGLPEWAVTVILLRDGQPVLTVGRQPGGGRTHPAPRGGGPPRNGQRLQVSAKTSLDAAAVVTGQAEAGQQDTY